MNIIFHAPDPGVFLGFIVLVLLLAVSALISGSEVAFFSLGPADLNRLKEEKGYSHRTTLRLHEMPEKLLATILVANNFVNVGIVILSSFIVTAVIEISNEPFMEFIFKVVLITFLLLLFGEILPKIHANLNAVRFSTFMAVPLFFLEKLFRPFSYLLIKSTSVVNKRISQVKPNISIDDLSEALNLPVSDLQEEEKILQGIVNFGNIDVSEIMTSRMDVLAVDIYSEMKRLLSMVIESGYSRIPVFEDSLDNIRGILYIKDLLPHINEPDGFNWQALMKPPYFVPETKKINMLLAEFQSKKIHMAIVVDEYGGTQGLVTLEDLLEEIVGEISDEFD